MALNSYPSVSSLFVFGTNDYRDWNLLPALGAVIFGAQSAVHFFDFGPDITNIRVVAERLVGLLGSYSTDQETPSTKPSDKPLEGHIRLNNLQFILFILPRATYSTA